MLSRLGLCISYSELQRVLATVEAEVDEQTNDENIFIPANIVSGKFTHFAIDNLDFSERTLDGSSMHMTSMVMYQPGLIEGHVFGKVPVNIRHKRTTHTEYYDTSIMSINTVHSVKKLKRDLFPEKANSMMLVFLQGSQSDTSSINLCWKLLRLCPSKLLEVEVDCPGWKVFHAMLNHKHIPVTAIGYCPFIPNSPTHPAVVAEAVKICMKTSKKLGMTHTVINQDESIYEIIYTLRKNAPDEYENLILRLGGFHF